MNLKLWQIDAFAEKPLEGNPAAIVPLDQWIDDGLMQKIAGENNLAETAYFVKRAPGHYELRWFTPTVEVPLCGHATLASAWTIFQFLDPSLDKIDFATKSGTLTVMRGERENTMSLPSDALSPYAPAPDYARRLGDALHISPPTEVLSGKNVFAVFRSAQEIHAIEPSAAIADLLPEDKGLIVTAKGEDGLDFISRYFAPHHGILEDPVTGSAHCALTPYWAKALGKKTLKARQVSPRGGNLTCTDDGARTTISGNCALYMTGEIRF